MSVRAVRTLATLALLGLVVSSCSSPEGTRAGPVRPAESSASEPSPESTGEGNGGQVPQVLRFSAPRLGGGTIDGEDFSGEDVALWFWAPW